MPTGCCRDERAINNKNCTQDPLHLAAFISIGKMHHGAKIFTKLGVCIEYVSTVQACIVALFPKQYKFSLHYTEDYKLLIDVQKQ